MAVRPLRTVSALALVAAFIAIYFGALWVSARASGWRAFAARYPDRPMVVARSLRGTVTSGVGFARGVSYSWVRVDVGDRGVRFTPWIATRFAHSPFLVPWRSVVECTAAPATAMRVRLRAVGVDRELAVFLRNAAALARACREHEAGVQTPAA